jgi:hypothetical protein
VTRANGHCSSARQPLVQALSQIKEPSLLRKLTAAGAQSTLSPVRRGPSKVNAAAGPSSERKPMERLGEEDEGEEEGEARGYDAAVRDRELANQKARIVSQMAGAAPVSGTSSSSTGQLSPRKTIPVSRLAPTNDARDHDPHVAKRDPRTSLFDVFAQNLANALAMAVTDDGFSTPGKASGFLHILQADSRIQG